MIGPRDQKTHTADNVSSLHVQPFLGSIVTVCKDKRCEIISLQKAGFFSCQTLHLEVSCCSILTIFAMFDWEPSSQEENCLPASSFSDLLGPLSGGNSDQKPPSPSDSQVCTISHFSFPVMVAIMKFCGVLWK